MRAPVNWSTPAQVWLQFGAGICLWYAVHLYYQRNVFAAVPSTVWLFAGLGALCIVINVGLLLHWRAINANIQAALRTPEMIDNEERFKQYVAFRQGEAALPKKRPMTRDEYIVYLENGFPKALAAYARMGVQLERPVVLQYIDPFFNFESSKERSEAVRRYFNFLNIYLTEYPEYDTK